ncbi:DUF447 domain-containing protein [Thermococcus waiotapuensis]|uniref:DUF447 family protein n=1 Tax=Thermococcus waiotapuensis TaxID=90909 RepID=A0AAE4NVD0_9EURY|nr:DUF447 domain-containing protein [Thermococcus waiotapuensis]MDV3104260.1 DUF447 family protein [Thermococcus waiotapuensis]
MELLDTLQEGKVYEVLLITRSNVTPVGVVRRGNRLFFKLFGGRSAGELKSCPYASIQFTNDVETIIKLALNLPLRLEFDENGEYRWIKGLPGVYGTVEAKEKEHEDELGKTVVLKCSLQPAGEIHGTLPPLPPSRADFYLMEMGVDITRLLIATRKGLDDVAKKLRERILTNYRMYFRLGGKSKLAEVILKMAADPHSALQVAPLEEDL